MSTIQFKEFKVVAKKRRSEDLLTAMDSLRFEGVELLTLEINNRELDYGGTLDFINNFNTNDNKVNEQEMVKVCSENEMNILSFKVKGTTIGYFPEYKPSSDFYILITGKPSFINSSVLISKISSVIFNDIWVCEKVFDNELSYLKGKQLRKKEILVELERAYKKKEDDRLKLKIAYAKTLRKNNLDIKNSLKLIEGVLINNE